MTPKKKAQIWGTITIVGFIFLLIDLLLMITMGIFTGLFIIGMLIFVIGVKFFIVYLYRVKKREGYWWYEVLEMGFKNQGVIIK
jgi:hypothetical protein